MLDNASISVFAFLLGVVAGLRAMTPPAAVSWAAARGTLDLTSTPLAFLGYAWTPWILTGLALVELVTDQLPTTPSRKVPVQFGARLVSGALAGGAVGAASGMLMLGVLAGIIGAVAGTFAGHAFRARLAALFGRDLPAALIEDAVAIGGALLLTVVR